MLDENNSSTRPKWWTLIPADMRNVIREWEAEIAAGTFNAEEKRFPFHAFEPETNTLKINIASRFLFPERSPAVASRYAPNIQIATLYCNDVPTSPRSVIAEEPEPSPELSPEPSPEPSPSDSDGSGMFVRETRPRERQLRLERGNSIQPSEPPSSPTRVRQRRPPASPSSESRQAGPSSPTTSSRVRRPRRQSTAPSSSLFALDSDSEDDRPAKKRSRRKPALEQKLKNTAYPVNEPRGKLYMDTRELRKLDLEEVKEKEGVRVRPEDLMHFTPRPEALEELEPLPANPRQGTSEGLFERLKDAAVDKHRDRLVNTTRAGPTKQRGWPEGKSRRERMKIKPNFGNFDD